MDQAHIDPLVADYIREPVKLTFADADVALPKRLLISGLESLFGVRKLVQFYLDIKALPIETRQFFSASLDKAGIQRECAPEQLARIPAEGPVIFVANHPFGVIDGLMLCELAVKTRGDFRIMLHSFLCQDRALAQHFLPVDFAGTRAAQKTNIRIKQLALQAVCSGTPLLIFPSGTVSTRDSMGFGELKEPPWSTFVAKMVRQANATVIPVYFEGENSRAFHVASNIALFLRSALGFNEVFNKFGQQFRYHIGEPIKPEDWQHCQGRQELTDFLEQHCRALEPE